MLISQAENKQLLPRNTFAQVLRETEFLAEAVQYQAGYTNATFA